MSRSQQYLDSLLSGVPLEELSAFESRAAFQQIKERLTGAQDVMGELKVLYRVQNFSELALQLMWLAQRSEQEPALLEPTGEEQTLVLSLFREAVGDAAGAMDEQPAAMQMETAEPAVEPEPAVEAPAEPMPEPEPVPEQPAGFGQTEETPQEETAAADPFGMGATVEAPTEASPEQPAEMPSEADPFGMASATEEPSGFGSSDAGGQASSTDFPADATPEPVAEAMADFPTGESAPPVAAPQPAASAGEGSPEEQFAKLVERFAEALQTGAEDRDAIKDEMLNSCSAVLAGGSGAPEDYQKFCQVMTDFISYIYENQFVDDIRVMNLLSNVPDPVWAWAKADEASRAGMMNAAYDTLREFKSLFE